MTTKIVVPEIGESVVEATVARWLKEEGDRVEAGEPVVELETDKVDLEVGAEVAGVLASIEAEAGESVKVGAVLGRIEPAGGGEEEAAPEDEEEEAREEPEEKEEKEEKGEAEEEEEDAAEEDVGEPGADEEEDGEGAKEKEKEKEKEGKPASPLARRVAEERGVDVDEVEGTGRGGRVRRADVETGKERGAPAGAEVAAREERLPLGQRRRIIARRLVEAQRDAAMLTTFNDVDMGELLELRDRHKDSFRERWGVEPGITSFFVKAAVAALKEYPVLNAEIDEDEVVLKHHYDIGIAVATDDGLLVPVVRDADRLSLAEIEVEIQRLAGQAREGTIALDDVRGGTFTITNGGVFGSLLSTPVLNPPQVGILGLHRIEERCVVRDRKPAVRPMMYLALTYDHRLIDGREAVRFLAHVRDLIQDGESLLLES